MTTTASVSYKRCETDVEQIFTFSPGVSEAIACAQALAKGLVATSGGIVAVYIHDQLDRETGAFDGPRRVGYIRELAEGRQAVGVLDESDPQNVTYGLPDLLGDNEIMSV